MRVLIFILTLVMVGVTQAAAQATDATLLPEGAQVYGDFCASCHNARPSSERTDLEWVAIVLHMRARANFTKREAAAVLAFLQATNLPEGGVAMGAVGRGGAVNVVLPDSLRGQLIAATARGEGTAVVRRPGGRQ